MLRTQVQFTRQQIEALRAQAAREEVSVSEIVRRAVDAWVRGAAEPSEGELRQRAKAAAGRFASGRGDVAAKHDDYLTEAYGR